MSTQMQVFIDNMMYFPICPSIYLIGFGIWFLAGIVSALNARSVVGMFFKFILNTLVAIVWPLSTAVVVVEMLRTRND